MSRASKLTLLSTSLFAAGTVIFVHFQQKAEKAVRTPLRMSIDALQHLPTTNWFVVYALETED